MHLWGQSQTAWCPQLGSDRPIWGTHALPTQLFVFSGIAMFLFTPTLEVFKSRIVSCMSLKLHQQSVGYSPKIKTKRNREKIESFLKWKMFKINNNYMKTVIKSKLI